MKIDYPDAILKLRSKLNISQERLAEMLNVSLPSVSRWENGHCEPTKIVKVKLNYLLKENSIEIEEE